MFSLFSITFLVKEQKCRQADLFFNESFQITVLYDLGNGLNSQVKEKIIGRLIWIHPSILLFKDAKR